MPLTNALVSPLITGKLGGEPYLNEVMNWLWPVDCQTCGRSLDGKDPVLAVDQLGPMAMASVHHETCRKSSWNDSGQISSTGNFVSYKTRLFLMPLTNGTQEDRIPTFILNPGLEYIVLRQDSGGAWRPKMETPFPEVGLVPPGEDLILDEPIQGLSARLTASDVTVLLPRPTTEILYSCPLRGGEKSFTNEVRRRQGVMLAVSHAVHPGAGPEVLPQQIWEAFQTGRMLLGWVALADG